MKNNAVAGNLSWSYLMKCLTAWLLAGVFIFSLTSFTVHHISQAFDRPYSSAHNPLPNAN